MRANAVRKTFLLTQTIDQAVRKTRTAAQNPVGDNESRRIIVVDVALKIDAREDHGVFLARGVNHNALGRHGLEFAVVALKCIRLVNLLAVGVSLLQSSLAGSRIEFADNCNRTVLGAHGSLIPIVEFVASEALEGRKHLFVERSVAGIACRIGAEVLL